MIDKKFELRQSILGLRGSFGAVLELFARDNNRQNYKIITADTATSAGLGRLKTNSPDLFIECGISEQSAAAIATGIALENIDVYLGSFSPFIVGRCWEQIRLASYMKSNFTIFGFGAGIGLSYLGFTHCSLEDCSLINTIPNTTIFEPATPSDIYMSLVKSSQLDGIKYIRLTGDGPVNKLLLGDHIQISENSKLYKSGSENVIVCSGYLASRIIKIHHNKIDILVINQITNVSKNDQLIDVLKSYKEILCLHESYENFIYKRIVNLGLSNNIINVCPEKRFSKPGDFDYVSDELNFDYRIEKFI